MKKLLLVVGALSVIGLSSLEETVAMSPNHVDTVQMNDEDRFIMNPLLQDDMSEESIEHRNERIRAEAQIQFTREQAVKKFFGELGQKAKVVAQTGVGLIALLLTATTEAVSRVGSLVGSLLFFFSGQKQKAMASLNGFTMKDSTTAHAWRALLNVAR